MTFASSATPRPTALVCSSFCVEAFSEDYAKHLDAMWDWKYDSHPLNGGAERVRRADRDKMRSNIAATYWEEIR